MTMLEKAARALCVVQNDEWPEHHARRKYMLMEQARAVLEAVRDECEGRTDIILVSTLFSTILTEGKSNDPE